MANTDDNYFHNFGEMIDQYRDRCTALEHIKEAWENSRETHGDKPTAYRFIRLHRSTIMAFAPPKDSAFNYTMAIVCHALADVLTPEELEDLRNQSCDPDSVDELLKLD